MAFLPGNTYGKGRKPGSKNKKTIAKESLNKLEEIGITPLETSKEIINSLVNNTELKNNEKLQLLNTMTSLFKYQLLTRAEEIKLDELQNEIIELENENQQLKDEQNLIFQGSPQDLLEHLKKETTNNDKTR